MNAHVYTVIYQILRPDKNFKPFHAMTSDDVLWNSKTSQNLMVICLMLSVSLCVCVRAYVRACVRACVYVCVSLSHSSRRAQLVTLHGAEYTERDIGAELRCSTTAATTLSSNSMLLPRFMTGNVLVVH